LTLLARQSRFTDFENAAAAVRCLVQHGASPLKRDSNGRNALDWGRKKGNETLVKIMRHAWYGLNPGKG
jgi:ankyrin repeat protein